LKPTRKNRLKKEKTARRQRWRGRLAFTVRAVLTIGVLMMASAGFIFVHDYFTQSSHFLVRDLTVTGMERLSRDQVLASGGIGPQTNVLSLNLAVTRKRLLATPWIAEATVRREIPSGLHISIREEQPLAFLEMDEGEGFLVNDAGKVFERAVSAAAGGLMRVQGLSHRDLPVPGKPDTAAFSSVMTLLRLSREKSNSLSRAGLRRILMDREIGATVFIGEDQQAIKVGFGHYREKCTLLGYLMAHLKKDSRLTKARVVDLYDVNRIVITLAQAGSSGPDQGEV